MMERLLGATSIFCDEQPHKKIGAQALGLKGEPSVETSVGMGVGRFVVGRDVVAVAGVGLRVVGLAVGFGVTWNVGGAVGFDVTLVVGRAVVVGLVVGTLVVGRDDVLLLVGFGVTLIVGAFVTGTEVGGFVVGFKVAGTGVATPAQLAGGFTDKMQIC